MTNDRQPASRPYTRQDLTRAGAAAAVWAVFYILLVAYAVFSPGQGPKLAADAAAVSVAADAGGQAHDVASRPHHNRAAR